MNQKLMDKLVHKAGARFGGDGVDYSNFEPKKFAELIVRKCAELATKEYNNRGAIHGNDLLKHFGVEE